MGFEDDAQGGLRVRIERVQGLIEQPDRGARRHDAGERDAAALAGPATGRRAARRTGDRTPAGRRGGRPTRPPPEALSCGGRPTTRARKRPSCRGRLTGRPNASEEAERGFGGTTFGGDTAGTWKRRMALARPE